MTTESERAVERAVQRSQEYGARLYRARRTHEHMVIDPVTGQPIDYIRESQDR
jgi:hypothetical protein